MNFLHEDIEHYIFDHADEEDALLKELNRKTNLELLHPEMLSGPIQGQFLSMMSKMVSPKRILEVGTYSGYGTICLASGLAEDGVLDTLEINSELNDIHEDFFDRAGIRSKVKLHYGDAMDTLKTLESGYDLIFLDADKSNYPSYYPMLRDLLRPGGIMLIDNVLWYGKVLQEEVHSKDHATRGVKKMNDLIATDDAVEKFILPIRDGVFMIRKK